MSDRPLYLIASALFFIGALYAMFKPYDTVSKAIFNILWFTILLTMGWIAFWRGF